MQKGDLQSLQVRKKPLQPGAPAILYDKVRSQRVANAAARKRLEMCTKWKEEIESGQLDPKKVFFAGEKLFRIGTLHSGSNHNYVVYVSLSKNAAPDGGAPPVGVREIIDFPRHPLPQSKWGRGGD